MIYSIEYLINEISAILGDTHLNSMQYFFLADSLKKAREMHKQEIIDAYNQADLDGYSQKTYPKYAEQYYNKTYNQNK